MAAGWDPWAVPEEEDILAPDNRTAPAPKAEGSRTVRLTAEDIDAVWNEVLNRLLTEKQWLQAPEGTALDDKWTTVTCDLYEWEHHDVKVEIGNGIIYIINNRPNENNTMQDTLTHGMGDACIGCIKHKDKLRVAVFTGEGRMYSAGGDPKAWQAQAASAQAGGEYTGDGTVGVRIPKKPMTEECIAHLNALGDRAVAAGAFPPGQVDIGRLSAAKSMHTICNLPQFTICLQNGSAMGGGVGWVCSCDYIIALKRSYLVLSEVKIGVIPATISPYVVQKMGVARSKRLFCCAENLTAVRAKEYGIVDEVVENMREGHERVRALVQKISQCGPRGVELAKAACGQVSGMPLGETLAHLTCASQTQSFENEEGLEGLAALQAKTAPEWQQTPIGFDVWPTTGVSAGKKGAKEADD